VGKHCKPWQQAAEILSLLVESAVN
jgi:hypothetical protein